MTIPSDANTPETPQEATGGRQSTSEGSRGQRETLRGQKGAQEGAESLDGERQPRGPVDWARHYAHQRQQQPTLEDLDAEPEPARWCCNGNAEDCRLCDTTTLPYPWICPGHPDTAENRARSQADRAPHQLHTDIAAAIFDTPAGYPADIARAVLAVPELQRVLAQAAAVERVRRLALHTRDRTTAGLNDWQIGQYELASAVLDLLGEQPEPEKPAHDAGPSVAECAKADRVWDVQKAGE
ncbi:hypothetical protein ACF09Y_22405 [Streptomyces massasporeus]|uniref:hypothetical protein n=1 Tax=Streptomyces massasporeus TaxID=67324 RepID=UPI0036F59C5D